MVMQSSLRLEWNITKSDSVAVGNFSVGNFSVEYSKDMVTWMTPICSDSIVGEKCVVLDRFAEVEGLMPYSNYTFRVFATNQYGSSNASKESEWTMTAESGTLST